MSAVGWRWVHACVVTLSLLVTFAAWHGAHQLVKERRAARFEREAGRIVKLVDARLANYADALQAGIAALDAAGGYMDRRQWRRFAEGLDLQRRYPGVNGIGFIERIEPVLRASVLERERRFMPEFDIHPPPPEDALPEEETWPILYIEPASSNREAIGFDVSREVHRRFAAIDALANDEARITGPVELVQDEKRLPGFLFFAPYRGGDRARLRDENATGFARASASETSEFDALHDRAAVPFEGLVYAPFVVADLIAGTLSRDERDVDVRIVDGVETIHDETRAGPYVPLYNTSIELPVPGRSWRFDISSSARFDATGKSLQPKLILIGGLVIDLMLFGLLLSITRSHRALKRSAAMSVELAARTRELESTNADLERFACVVSHDLKTPVRGISDLAWYLEEDLEPWLSSPAANPEVREHLSHITTQTRRMDALIDGILDYSGIGQRTETPERVDVRAMLDDIGAVLKLTPGQLRVTGELPIIETYRVRLEQVLANLVDNGFKYNPNPERAIVTVSAERVGDHCRLRVSDNGPGIDPRFHQRIFEIFETLQRKDEIESTGIGLAIVKRTVEHVGGQVRVQSVPGQGTTFHIEWPIGAIEATEPTLERAA